MSLTHFSHHDSMSEAMVGFSELCRQSGLPIGLGHTQEAIQASKLGLIKDENTFRYSLKSLFCTCIEEHPTFDKCFDVYWKKRKHSYAHKTNSQGSSNIKKKGKSSLVMAASTQMGIRKTPKSRKKLAT